MLDYCLTRVSCASVADDAKIWELDTMATTYTWAGSNGAWSVGNSWVGGVPPGQMITDVILFDGTNPVTASVDVSFTYNPDQLIVTNPNAILVWADSENLAITGGSTSGIDLSAGILNIAASSTATFAELQTYTGSISGGVINLGLASEFDVENNGTLTLTSTGSLSLTAGEIDIGSQTSKFGEVSNSSTPGLVHVNGGEALITGGNITGLAFTIDAGAFVQSAGHLNFSGLASFSGGTNTVSDNALFQAGTVAIGTNFSINGGTIQANSGGAGITLAATKTLTMGTGATTATLDGTNGGITNSGTIVGQGAIEGAISGGGLILASGGILDVTNAQSGDSFNIDTLAASVLKFDGSSETGGTITFNGGSIGVLDLQSVTVLGGFTDIVSDEGTVLGAVGSAAALAGKNYIDLFGVSVGSIVATGGTLNEFTGSGTTGVIFNAGGSAIGTIAFAGVNAGSSTFVDWVSDGAGGTDVFLSNTMCYAEGTRILTPQGEVTVESLNAGDLVVTLLDGQPVPMPIKWMGVRQIAIAGHPSPYTVAPIRIHAGAFGDDLPRRDLLVSPAHAIFVDGKLVPANLLINNMTIVQELHTTAVTYYHVELDRHSLILAEGLTSESYLDTGNRAYFSNAGLALVLHPEFHVNAGLKQWAEDACAPLAIDAETIAPIWHELADRAETLGYVPPRFTTTQDADLYLEANGRRLRPVAVAQGRHTFMLPAGTGDIVLRSRTSAPADLNPLSGDRRPLGVAVRAMTLRAGDDHIVIPADHPALKQGWHTAEAANGTIWRWTAGSATIPMQTTAGPAMLDIDVGSTATYILARSDRQEQRIAA
jgi:antigen 43